MKKKHRTVILSICPVMIYMIWFTVNVRAIAARHLEQDINYPTGVCITAFFILIYLILRKIKRKSMENIYFLIPLFYFAIGLFTLAVGYHTPCCTGG